MRETAERDRHAERATRVTRQTAERLSATLSRAADALADSARLAEEHAVRQVGRSEAVADQERRVAARARAAADRARQHAEEWMNVAAGQQRTQEPPAP